MSHKSLKILHWNTNGITNKISELVTLLSIEKIDIALIGETKIKPSSPIKIPNYISYRTDNPIRPGGSANGGTVTFINRHIIHRHVKIKTKLNSTSVEISIGSHQIRISAVYKKPQTPLDPKDLDSLMNGCDWFIIVGNMNAKHSLWNSSSIYQVGRVLYGHVQQADFAVFASTIPTHFLGHPGHRPDVLGVTLVKLPHYYTNIQNLNDLSSDHNPILLSISDTPISSSPPSTTRRINWSKYTTKLNDLITEKLPPINTPD